MLEDARTQTHLPLLRKDFIIDSYQILESRVLGADAILLIVNLLGVAQLKEFIAKSTEVGLETLVEVHEEKDLMDALEAGATCIGINNRNLRTLRVDPQNAKKILSKMPKRGITAVVESGIKESSELPFLREQGANAVLIGETFMRAEDPEKAVREFTLACQK